MTKELSMLLNIKGQKLYFRLLQEVPTAKKSNRKKKYI